MAKLQQWFWVFVTGWVVCFFLYPTVFTFMSWNTKLHLALLGPVIMGIKTLRQRNYTIDTALLGTLFIAGLYSVINLFATDYNGYADYSYATYIMSALVWLFSAYTMTSVIEFTHGKISFRLIVYYFAAVTALNCILTQAIDSIPFVKGVVDSIFLVHQGFIEETGRLYGIGFMLDPAGTRMAMILIMIAYVVSHDEKTMSQQSTVNWLLLAYFIIVGLGNIVSRTTVTGAALSVLMYMSSAGSFKQAISFERLRLYRGALILLLVIVPVAIYMYNTDEIFYYQIRYGFEGFFSLFEKGEWQTDSNDVLATMWRWPETTAGWLIGYGEFDGFRFGTDIGYCRLILYSGVIGFSVFAFLFVFQFLVFSQRYPKQSFLFFLMMAMSFIIWFKVSTDVFQFWTIFYCFHQKSWLAPKYKLALGYNQDDNDD